MQKANETSTPEISKVIKITKEQLRMIADKMEFAERNCLPGETVYYKLTPNISLYYDPEICAYSAAADTKRIEQ